MYIPKNIAQYLVLIKYLINVCRMNVWINFVLTAQYHLIIHPAIMWIHTWIFDAWNFWKIGFWQMSVFHIVSLGHSNREIVARLVPFPSFLRSWLTSFRIRQWKEKLLEHYWKPSSKVIMPLLSRGSLARWSTFGSFCYFSCCLKPHWSFSVWGILQNQ